MKLVFAVLIFAILTSCVTYKGGELWRRSTCNGIVDAQEKARCLEDATRSESDYKQDVEAAKTN